MKVRNPYWFVQEDEWADREIAHLTGPGCCPDCDRNQSAWDNYQSRLAILATEHRSQGQIRFSLKHPAEFRDRSTQYGISPTPKR